MPKSIKLTDNTFWDSTGIVHNKELLSEILGNGKLDGIEISDTEPEDESVQFWLDTSEDMPTGGTSGDTFPIGAVIEWHFNALPDDNWLWTDHDYKIADYPELYALCGTTFNISTTPNGYFRTPNKAGLVSVGTGTYTDENGKTKTFELNQKVGEYENKLTIEKMPEHNHPAPSGYDESNWYVMYSEASQGYGTYAGGTYQYTRASKSIQPQGGNEPHNNTQPSIGVNYIIKARHSVGVEQQSGNEYMNGKKVYIKDISTTETISGGDNATHKLIIPHQIENVDMIWIDLGNSFFIEPTSKTSYPLIMTCYSDINNTEIVQPLVDSTNIYILSSGGWGESWEKHIRIKYTKAID